MMEIDESTKKGYVYGKPTFQRLSVTQKIDFVCERDETIDDIRIFTVMIKSKIEPNPLLFGLQDFKNIRCSHGNKFNHKTVHRLPQEGWQELIDCWSCHNCEFKSMLDLNIRPRKDGILVSNFYLLANENIVPDCCKNGTKFCYEDLKFDFPDSFLVFKFFEDYFFANNSLVIEYENRKYEIKIFYFCLLFIDDFERVIKIGIRETERIPDSVIVLSDHYKKIIFNIININKINIEIMGFQTSFIRYR